VTSVFRPPSLFPFLDPGEWNVLEALKPIRLPAADLGPPDEGGMTLRTLQNKFC
jgi:hypothetical protein